MKKLLPAVLVLLLLSACATREIRVVTYPSDAQVTATGRKTRVQPTETGALVTPVSSTEPIRITVAAPDHQPVTLQVRATDLDPKRPLEITLPRFREEQRFVFSSIPAGAVVTIDGKEVGRTPLEHSLEFRREDARSPWEERKVTYSLEDWETMEFVVRHGDARELRPRELQRLRHTIPVRITATTAARESLAAEVRLNGIMQGTTPATVSVPFARTSGTESWPVFSLEVGITDRYLAQTRQLSYPGSDSMEFTLLPIIEMPVKRQFPMVAMTPQGARLQWDETVYPGAIDTSESLSNIADIRAITRFEREDPRQSCVNSFTLTPDGQYVIYGVTTTTETGRFSNLWQSRAQELSTSRRQITEGPYLDTHPVMGNLLTNETLVFQSNRGFRESIDISSVRLVQGQVLGGIRQLTREQRFNYSPTFTNQEWDVYYVSLEDRFTLARPQISFMSLDGSLPTYLNEYGDDLTLSPDGSRIYFCRPDSGTGNIQIYSIPTIGRPITQVITRSAFMSANCFSPAISPDGQYMLFVSDVDADHEGRRNHNIYLLHLETGNISPVTQNFSDDLAPKWSPVEPNVLFFLSNRGGAYNIWRIRLTTLN